MSDNTTVSCGNPAFADELTDLVRDGAQRIIKQTVQAELDAFLNAHEDTGSQGRRQASRAQR